MTNSNDRNNLAADQTDDLIAELARIVADDAKQSTVSQAVDERAQMAATAREQLPDQQSFDAISHPGPVDPPVEEQTSSQPTSTEADVVPFGGRDEALPFSQIGEGVTAVPSAQNATTETVSKHVDQGNSPFEFDFSQNIQAGVGETQLPKVDSKPFVEPTADAEVLPETSEEAPTPDVLDGIAAIIEDVEKQSAPQPEPEFEPIPVPQETIAVQQDEVAAEDRSDFTSEPEVAHERDTSFEFTPQRDLEIPDGEDEFAVPPSQTSDGADLDAVIDDPLAEIESLIADTQTPAPAPQSKPADAAEAAIMAALASATSQPKFEASPVAAARASASPRQEPRFDADVPTARDSISPALNETPAAEPEQEYIEERRRGGVLPILASVAAILLLAVIGGVGYWFFVGQGPSDGDVPVVAAQNTNVKEVPEVTPAETEAQGQSVFNALEGNTETPTEEQIVSRDETAGASGTEVARVVTPTSSSNGLTNRKVKTVTVLADGTIVSGNEASAGAEQLPQDVRPNAPTVAVETPNSETDEIANVLNAIKEGTDAATTSTPATAPALPDTSQGEATEATAEPATPIEVAAIADDPAAPTPPARPFGLGSGSAPSLAPVAASTTPTSNDTVAQPISLLPTTNSTPSVPTSATSTTSGVAAPFYVQLASQRTLETAQATATTLKRQFPSQLGSQPIDINQVDLGDKGIYFRVRVPSNSLADANALCSSLKSNGGDCFVRNN
ncbi:SPOR domain-containing protein [Maritalea porphyrae]|uniref:SPOR domain-containing protein n=1 Tax=Maritalea porphyrae TaxID=880732 RepID=A0ABQ5UT92_9HYPH|nr:SPOR domain-containing protein [Maritalea porphyrae]GLQ18331.1 hypothetical protein GCM10007879_25800 [Maritalea porphyrae]